MEVGYVRAVAPNYTFFAVETFVDELAHLAGVDPLEFRLRMLGGAPRLQNALRLVADRAGWARRSALPKNLRLGSAGVADQGKARPTLPAHVDQCRVDPDAGSVRAVKV